jgi:hypothetical protein
MVDLTSYLLIIKWYLSFFLLKHDFSMIIALVFDKRSLCKKVYEDVRV